MNIFDIFVLPSLSEGLSNVLLEAMALCKPIVATNVGGNPEIITDNQTGMLVPPGSTEKIANAVMSLFDSKTKKERMGQQGYLKVKKIFPIWKTVSDYQQVYLDILQKM